MEKIVNYPFKHIWEEKEISGNSGCENCSIAGLGLCPKDCQKETGRYRYMTFDELKFEKFDRFKK